MKEVSGVYTSPFLHSDERKMAWRARNVSGAFEKRAPGQGWVICPKTQTPTENTRWWLMLCSTPYEKQPTPKEKEIEKNNLYFRKIYGSKLSLAVTISLWSRFSFSGEFSNPQRDICLSGANAVYIKCDNYVVSTHIFVFCSILLRICCKKITQRKSYFHHAEDR